MTPSNLRLGFALHAVPAHAMKQPHDAEGESGGVKSLPISELRHEPRGAAWREGVL
jgi:hypothetical protein